MRCAASGPSPKARPKAEACLYSMRCAASSPSQKRNPEPDHGNPNPRCAPNCWCACVGIFTPMRKRDKGDVTDGGCGGLRRVLRTVAAGALEGRRYGRWLRELSKGDVTDGGCGGLRGVSRAVAACSRRPWCPPKLSAAVGRGASLRPFRCRRPWRLPSSLPLPSAVTPSEDFRCRRPWRLPYLSFA